MNTSRGLRMVARLISRLAIMLLVLPLAACQAAAERPTAILAMNATEMFPDPQVRALATAAARGDVERVSRLVQQGLDVDSEGVRGITPLFWAMQRLNRAGFKRLLELGADPNHLWDDEVSSVMYYAPRVSDPYFLQQALLHGGDAIGEGLPFAAKPLINSVSSSNSHPDSVRMLIDAGADVNLVGPLGITPLLRSALHDRYDLTYILLNTGADPTLGRNTGNTFFYYLRVNKGASAGIPGMTEWREKAIELLRERGYDVE